MSHFDDSYFLAGVRIKSRIGKDTKLGNLFFAGDLDGISIQDINRIEPYIEKYFHYRLQRVIEENKGAPPSSTIPKGVETGVLEDSEELQQIIRKLEWIEEWRKVDMYL